MRLLNQTQEAVLRLLLDSYEADKTENLSVLINYDKKPGWLQFGEIDKTIERLEKEGIYLQSFSRTLSHGDLVYLTPQALTYFDDKERYLSEQSNKTISSAATTINFNAPVVQANIADNNSTISATQNNEDIVEDGNAKRRKWKLSHTLTLIGSIIIPIIFGLLTLFLSQNTPIPYIDIPNMAETLPYTEEDSTYINRDLTEDFKCLNFLVAVREAIGKTHGPIFVTDFEEVEVLDISGRGITSLAGIEHFIDVIELDISQNPLDYVDVSSNLALEILSARNIGLTTLDISNNHALRILRISRNNIAELNVYYNRALEEIEAEWNRLTVLDLSYHTRMRRLSLGVNELVELHIWDLRIFEDLNVVSNPIASDSSFITTRWTRETRNEE